MANILVLGVKIPFTGGGQVVLVNSLVKELKGRGHLVDVVELPHRVEPKENLLNEIAMWRALDLREFGGRKVDLVIATKFPSYFAKHPKKSLWLVHQHRDMYDNFGTRYSSFSDDPRDDELRDMLKVGDDKAISECSFVSGISKNVVTRLKNYNGIEGVHLYPPLSQGDKYYNNEPEDYILSVNRLCSIKRIDLIIKALPIIHNHIKLKIVGTADEPHVEDYFKNEIDKHHLWDRVEFLGRVTDEELLSLYAKSLAVFYGPYNEDYGYGTLEAFASSKPVVTCPDSGGVLEFVRDMENGLILEPNTDSIGHGVNKLVEDKDLAIKLGLQGRADIEKLDLLTSGWDEVVEGLLSPLNNTKVAANG